MKTRSVQLLERMFSVLRKRPNKFVRAIGIVAICSVESMFLTAPANAGSVDRCGNSGVASCARGSVTVHKDVTSWDLTVKDSGDDKNCAYAKMIIDRNNREDVISRSPNACGKDKEVKFTGNTQNSGTRGARVEVCIDRNNRSDKCTKIHYEYETN
jgi:hypothetical protein